MNYEVVLAQSFQNCFKQLKKRYPKIGEDVKSAIYELQSRPTIGSVIPGGDGARKLRLPNSSANRGKSGGFRLIYFIRILPSPAIVLILLYSKSDQSDVDLVALRQLMSE